MGLGFLLGGGEAIVTRRMAFQLRGARSATYRGWGAVFYGIVFVWIGIALIAAAGILALDVGETIIRSTTRRPGFALVNVGLVVLAFSGIAFTGPTEARPERGMGRFSNLISTILRLIPATILVALGLALLGLGVLEIVSPGTFDQIGGGSLELLYQGPSP